MERLACVDLPALPLQLLLARHPDWAAHPAAVVAEERPQAPILWVNEQARTHHVLPGRRYAEGLSRVSTLRAGVVEPAEIEAVVHTLVKRLKRYTPEVEPAAEEPGVFWLNAGGLHRLYPDLRRWADAVQATITGLGYQSNVVVGYTRFGSYALARLGQRQQRPLVLPDLHAERAQAAAVPISRLGFEPKLRDALHRLGVDRLGDFIKLPKQGLELRFGPEVRRLHQLATGELFAPLVSYADQTPPSARFDLETPEDDIPRLLFLTKRRLDRLLARLAERRQALAALRLRLTLEPPSFRQARPQVEAHIQPAAPTLEITQLMDLLRLRLEALALPHPVAQVRLETETGPAEEEQLRLFERAAHRNMAAANRALARLRAELGEDAVVHAVLREGHLPESKFRWEPLAKLERPLAPERGVLEPALDTSDASTEAAPETPMPAQTQLQLVLPDAGPPHFQRPRPDEGPPLSADNVAFLLRIEASPDAGGLAVPAETPETEAQLTAKPESGLPPPPPEDPVPAPPPPLIRRILLRPKRLAQQSPTPDGWFPAGLRRGNLTQVSGPYVITGGWWRRTLHREYYYAETREGDLLWIYFDRERRCWMQQGQLD